MKEHVYLIHCPGMDRADRVVIKTLQEFMRLIEQYIARYSDIDLIYRER